MDPTVTSEKRPSGTITVAELLARWLAPTLERWDEQILRAQRLAALRLRHRWKLSDRKRLEALGITLTPRQIQRLRGTGRPSVRELSSPATPFFRSFAAGTILFLPGSSRQQRINALRQWHWWPHHVEALYRGERMENRFKSDQAEQAVGRILGISPALIRKLCQRIRQERRRWDGAANFRPMTLKEFLAWMDSGVNPCLDDPPQPYSDS